MPPLLLVLLSECSCELEWVAFDFCINSQFLSVGGLFWFGLLFGLAD